MNQPNLLDLLLAIFMLGSVLGACSRGLGREMLHTVLFGAAALGGFWYVRDALNAVANPVESAAYAQEVARLFLNLAYYTATAYVLTWALMKVLTPLILDGNPIGFRSRFWGGMLALAKLGCLALGLNLWLAVNSPDAHPLRLNNLPAIAQTSVLVQLSDKTTEDIYKYLASHGFLTYHKYTQRPATPAEEKLQDTYQTLGLDEPPATLQPMEPRP